MVSVSQAIVVEGRYDKNTLSQIVDAPIFQTDGFHIMRDPALTALLRQVAKKRGLIVFTDSDGAGFVIRNYLKGVIPPENLLHAYAPEIPGKERRKRTPGKEGILGVEGMTPDVIVECLKRAGATMDGLSTGNHFGGITKQDLFEMGLSGCAGSEAMREKLLKKLDFPAKMSTNAMLQALNVLYGKEDLEKIRKDL